MYADRLRSSFAGTVMAALLVILYGAQRVLPAWCPARQRECNAPIAGTTATSCPAGLLTVCLCGQSRSRMLLVN